MKPLGERRLRILHAIGDYTDDHGYSPSLRDVASAAGLSSINATVRHLRLLQDAQLVASDPGTHRQLRLTDKVARSRNGVLAQIVPVVPCGPCGQDMPADHECKALAAKLRRHLHAVADQIPPEGRTATPAGTRAAATRHVNGARVMTKSTESPRRPWETMPGDVIVRHPDNPEQEIEARITGPYRGDGYRTWLDYEMPDGSIGTFVFEPGQLVTIRGVTYTVEALLTEDEREQAFLALSDDDFGALIAHVRELFPEVFDAAMAALGRTKARLSAVPEAGA